LNVIIAKVGISTDIPQYNGMGNSYGIVKHDWHPR